jgi:hypothetical protein
VPKKDAPKRHTKMESGGPAARSKNFCYWPPVSRGLSYMSMMSLASVKLRPKLVSSVPAQFHRMVDGDRVRIGRSSWRCISGYRHAPEHMALHCEALLPNTQTTSKIC